VLQEISWGSGAKQRFSLGTKSPEAEAHITFLQEKMDQTGSYNNIS